MNCPKCSTVVTETKGSLVSPYLNVYRCPQCEWQRLRCGDKRCDGYLEAQEMGYPNTVRYNCVTCGWTGTGARFR